MTETRQGTKKAGANRRDFLKLASTAAPAAVAAAAMTGGEAEAAPADEQGSGLRDTAHVRAYLASARF